MQDATNLKSVDEMLADIEALNLDEEVDNEAMEAAIADMEFDMIDKGHSIESAIAEIDTDILMSSFLSMPLPEDMETVEVSAKDLRESLRFIAQRLRN